MATEMRWNRSERSLSWFISDSRDSMTQTADELKCNDIDGVYCYYYYF